MSKCNPRRFARRSVVVVSFSLIALFVATAGGIAFVLNDPAPVLPGLRLPDTLAYSLHAHAAEALNHLGGSPDLVGIQWIKAASHAREFARVSDQVTQAAEGIRAARGRAAGSDEFDARLCEMVRSGSPSTQGAVEQAGIDCGKSSQN